jgi:hypothetical protein
VKVNAFFNPLFENFMKLLYFEGDVNELDDS